MDRRRRLHLRQLGVNLKSGKNDMNGKNDKIGMDGGNVKNEYSFLEPSVTLQDSGTFVGSKKHFAYRHPRMLCTRGEVKTECLSVRT